MRSRMVPHLHLPSCLSICVCLSVSVAATWACWRRTCSCWAGSCGPFQRRRPDDDLRANTHYLYLSTPIHTYIHTYMYSYTAVIAAARPVRLGWRENYRHLELRKSFFELTKHLPKLPYETLT